MKNLKLILFTGIIVLSIASCDNLDGLNTDTKGYETVPASSLLTNAQNSYSYFLTNASVNSNNFKAYAQQWTGVSYTDEMDYNQTNRNLGGSLAGLLYRDVLQDLAKAEKLVKEEKALGAVNITVQKNNISILEIQTVMVYQTLVDLFGDVAYSQALDIVKYPTPKYDDAKTIYLDLASRLDSAIANLDSSQGSFGSADIIYNGDVSNWKKLANSVKLKMGLHLVDVDPAKAKSMIESAFTSGVITANSENALFEYFNVPTSQNPLYDSLVNEQQIVPTKLIVNELNTKSDPRRDVYFNPASKIGGVYVGAPYAQQAKYSDFSNMGERIKSKTNPGVLFDNAETNFLLADAANRGFSVGGTAAEYYEKGIRSSMLYWGVSSADTNTYLMRADVAFATASGTAKEKIADQLWIAYFNRGFEAWTEYRRLDFPILAAPVTAVAEANGKVPVRNIYSITDKTLNKDNYNAAAIAIGGDLITTKIFWDKF